MRFRGPASVKKLPEILKTKVMGCELPVGNCTWKQLQANAIWVYEHYFASDVRVIAGLLELLGRRIDGSRGPVKPVKGLFQTASGFCGKMAELERKLEVRGN